MAAEAMKIGHSRGTAHYGVVIATPDCEIRFASRNARRWLKEFFGRPARAALLPRKVCQWLSAHRRLVRTNSLIVRRGEVRLFIRRYLPGARDAIALLLELVQEQAPATRRTAAALTRREKEVLFWIAKGEPNREIGRILGIAQSTVGKHLEHTYSKLGVKNRTAAARLCRRNAGASRRHRRAPH